MFLKNYYNLAQSKNTFINCSASKDKTINNASNDYDKTPIKKSYNIHDLINIGFTSEQIHTYFDNVEYDPGKTLGVFLGKEKNTGKEATPHWTLKDNITINGKIITSFESLCSVLKINS